MLRAALRQAQAAVAQGRSFSARMHNGLGFRRSLTRPTIFAVVAGSTAWATAAAVDAYPAPRKTLYGHVDDWRRKWNPPTQVMNVWDRLTSNQKVLAGIITGNVLIFGLWRVAGPRMLNFLGDNFLLWGLSNRAFPMLGSSLSHMGPLHLLGNMVTLWSFGPLVLGHMGISQFLAFCVSSSLASSLGFMAHARAVGQNFRGLGFSGILYSIIGFAAVTYPNLQIGVFFLPLPYIDIQQMLMFMMAVDALGIALGWRLLGHAAHLGGAMFGIAYARLVEPEYAGFVRKMRVWLQSARDSYIPRK